jgi:hypothetical protein
MIEVLSPKFYFLIFIQFTSFNALNFHWLTPDKKERPDPGAERSPALFNRSSDARKVQGQKDPRPGDGENECGEESAQQESGFPPSFFASMRAWRTACFGEHRVPFKHQRIA